MERGGENENIGRQSGVGRGQLERKKKCVTFTSKSTPACPGVEGCLHSGRYVGAVDDGKSFHLHSARLEREAGKVYFNNKVFEDMFKPLIAKAEELWAEEAYRLETTAATNQTAVAISLNSYANKLEKDLRDVRRTFQQQSNATSKKSLTGAFAPVGVGGSNDVAQMAVEVDRATHSQKKAVSQRNRISEPHAQKVYALQVLDEIKQIARNKSNKKNELGEDGSVSIRDQVPFCDRDFPPEHRVLVATARDSWVRRESELTEIFKQTKETAMQGVVLSDSQLHNLFHVTPDGDLCELPEFLVDVSRRQATAAPTKPRKPREEPPSRPLDLQHMAHNEFLQGFAAVLVDVSHAITEGEAFKKKQEHLADKTLDVRGSAATLISLPFSREQKLALCVV